MPSPSGSDVSKVQKAKPDAVLELDEVATELLELDEDTDEDEVAAEELVVVTGGVVLPPPPPPPPQPTDRIEVAQKISNCLDNCIEVLSFL